MHKQINLIIQITLIVTIFWSCSKSQNQETFIENNSHPAKENEDTLLAAELPIEIDSSNYIAFPVLQQNSERERGSFKISKAYEEATINLIFKNIETSKTHFLTDKKIKIINFNQLKNNDNQPEKVILYSVIDKNYDEDDFITTSLYLSNNDGKNFTKVSPENYHVTNWKYIPKTKKVYFMTVLDTNKNKEIDKEDTFSMFYVSIENFKSKEILKKELETLNL